MATDSEVSIPVTGEVSPAPFDQITRLGDTIAACDRLCLLSVRTILRSAVKVTGNTGAHTYLPSLSHDLCEFGAENVQWPRLSASVPWYPTTAAHCIAALQVLLPVVERFKLGTQQSKDLAFHPIERSALEAFDLKRLPSQIREAIDDGLKAFQKEGLDPGYKAAGSEFGLTDDDVVEMCLHSTTFGAMHPFTAAQVLRAVAPSSALFGPAWWRSLFIASWFLNRRGSSLRGYPNTQATASPGTAYLTHKCVAAVEIAYSVLDRRWSRFTRLTELTRKLREVQTRRQDLAKLKKQIKHENFSHGFNYQETILIREIRAALEEIAKDTGIQIYQRWNRYLNKSEDSKILEALVDGFVEAVAAELASFDAKVIIDNNNKPIEEIHDAVKSVYNQLCSETDWPNAPRSGDWSKIPSWACSRNYWSATMAALPTPPKTEARERMAANLRNHWRRHHEATTAAHETMKGIGEYFTQIIDCYTALCSVKGADKVKIFQEKLEEAAKRIPRLHRQMWGAIDTGVWWADILMNRHLGYAESGSATLFDPSELAHALRVVCRDRRRPRLNAVLAGLRAICAAQHDDGTWPCRQPIHWTDTGQSVPTISVETALAVVATVSEVVRNPEAFGASAEEVSAGLQPAYAALDRFFAWLSGSMQSVPVPPALADPDPANREPALYGWCSDRVFEPGRIQSWVTAYAVEFLVEFRGLLQERINAALRSQFHSFHPAELTTPLSQLLPTDLGKLANGGGKEPVIGDRLLMHLRDHKGLEFAEGPWVPEKPEPLPISFYSAILYGPPGSSKTFLAKAIAAELRWPLISLSPADFLAGGQDQVEARAKSIFAALAAGSRLVYFFDEIDELIRGRDQLTNLERSVFSFLTPSFLTKLQDLRDAAKDNEFIFLLGTNYLDNIDSAAKRSGRIDEQLAIVYPDAEARGNIFIQEILKSCKDNVASLGNALLALNQNMKDLVGSKDGVQLLDLIAEFSGFLSYPKLDQLAKHIQCMIAATRVTTDEELRGEKIEALIRTLSDAEAIKARQFQRGSGPPRRRRKAIVNIALAQTLRDLYFLQVDDSRGRFKPELKLAEYSGRPEAIDEIKLVAGVIPDRPLPWRWDNVKGWQESEEDSRRLKELEALKEAVDKKARDQHDGIDLSNFAKELGKLVELAESNGEGQRRRGEKRTAAAAAPLAATSRR